MDRFFQEIQLLQDVTSRATILEAFLAIFLSFVLTLFIGFVYRWTHRGARYSQSFVQTIIIMGVVVSIIMIVIGNNIAVAFGLVGAFSIIRFRSAMSDPKDIAFIFFGMAAGIASGLGFYLLAVLFTFSLSVIIFILHVTDFAKSGTSRKRLRVTIPENLHYEQVFDDVLEKHLKYFALRSVETTNLGTMIQLEYVIQHKEDTNDKLLIDDIRAVNANLKVAINYLNAEDY